MEHNIHHLLREKIRAAENREVSWQKDRVWQMIRTEEPKKRQRAYYYYAAASVVIFLSLMIFGTQLNNQKMLALRIASLEARIAQKSGGEDKSERIHKISGNLCPSNSSPTIGRRVALKRYPADLKIVNEIKTSLKTLSTEDILVTEVSPEIPLLTSLPAPEKREVIAIIGFIPQEEPVVVKTKRKRSRINLFKAPENGPEINLQEESRLLTARIN